MNDPNPQAIETDEARSLRRIAEGVAALDKAREMMDDAKFKASMAKATYKPACAAYGYVRNYLDMIEQEETSGQPVEPSEPPCARPWPSRRPGSPRRKAVASRRCRS